MFVSQDDHVEFYIHVDSNNGCILIDEHDIYDTIKYHCQDIDDAEYHLSMDTAMDVILIVPKYVVEYIDNTYGIKGY